jgi:pimeloyl-ACP methyl ester carboxylesterase
MLLIPETHVYPIGFLDEPNSLKVLVKSIELDTTRLFIWDIGRNCQDYLPITAHQGNLEIRSIHANLLLLEHTHCAKHRFYIFDLTTRILTQLNGFNGSIGMSRFINDQEILATISDTTYPSRLVILVIRGILGQLQVEDMVAARDWLIKQGIANPAAILVTGGSYGGYLTLQSLSTTPDLWAGGIAEVAVADWLLLYSDPANIGASLARHYLGGTPEENPEAYKVASPLTYAQQIRAPLLVIQVDILTVLKQR